MTTGFVRSISLAEPLCVTATTSRRAALALEYALEPQAQFSSHVYDAVLGGESADANGKLTGARARDAALATLGLDDAAGQ